MVNSGRDRSLIVELSATVKNLREEGNTYFSKGKYGAAIDKYTEIVVIMVETNKQRSDWTRVEEDSRKAIQLDSNCVKGHYTTGLALLHKQEYPEGVKELERALDLGRGADPNGYMVEEIWQELAKAKYMEWEQASSERAWELQKLKQACESALKEKHDAFQMEGFLDEAGTTHMKQLQALERVFEKAAEADTASEVPDYLCCRITLDIFRDPVITPSGVTYERSVILNHLEKVGEFDPITREPVEPSQLIPNFAIKEAVQAYLQENGWAYRTW